jgi:hypothetical protein
LSGYELQPSQSRTLAEISTENREKEKPIPDLEKKEYFSTYLKLMVKLI